MLFVVYRLCFVIISNLINKTPARVDTTGKNIQFLNILHFLSEAKSSQESYFFTIALVLFVKLQMLGQFS